MRDEEAWELALQRGIVAKTAHPVADVIPDWNALQAAIESAPPAASTGDALEVSFRTDSRVFDGRFTNNAWLLELPDPITKLTWDNAALLSPKTGARFSVSTESTE